MLFSAHSTNLPVVKVKKCCSAGGRRVLVCPGGILKRAKLIFSQHFQDCKIPYVEIENDVIMSNAEYLKEDDVISGSEMM